MRVRELLEKKREGKRSKGTSVGTNCGGEKKNKQAEDLGEHIREECRKKDLLRIGEENEKKLKTSWEEKS